MALVILTPCAKNPSTVPSADPAVGSICFLPHPAIAVVVPCFVVQALQDLNLENYSILPLLE